MDKVNKAKAALIIDHPFFASLLLSMPITYTQDVPTMATNGELIKINPQFVESLNSREVLFVLAHEVLHSVFLHPMRRESRDANRWNIACDHIINDLLIKDNIGTMPAGGLHDASLVAKGGATAEGVYNLLPEQDSPSPGQAGGALDSLETPSEPMDAATRAQKENEIKVKVIQARNAAKMQGRLSSGVARLVEGLVNTKKDWRDVLREYISKRAKVEPSFARPKRRFIAQDLYLPSQSGEVMGSLVVAVDCSGSVCPKTLAAFESEIRAICQDVAPASLKIIYFDSEVLKTEDYSEDYSDVRLKPIGGGGTAFSPVFDLVNKENEAPAACVVLTDLDCDDFGPAPSYPVIWASNGQNVAPFGEVIKLLKD